MMTKEMPAFVKTSLRESIATWLGKITRIDFARWRGDGERRRKQNVHVSVYAWSSSGMRSTITAMMPTNLGKIGIMNTAKNLMGTEQTSLRNGCENL